MAEVFICKAGTVKPRSIRELRSAGVVVVESETPEQCQFLRASEIISGHDMLFAALSALQLKGDYGSTGTKQREELSRVLLQIVVKNRETERQIAPPEPKR